MKIFIICSKAFYSQIPPIQGELEMGGHKVVLPNSYNDPEKEARAWGDGTHQGIKGTLILESIEKIKDVDAVLTLNFEKNGQNNYIGGATFLELYEAFKENKKIFLWNNIPEGILHDEIHGFAPIVINGDLGLVK